MGIPLDNELIINYNTLKKKVELYNKKFDYTYFLNTYLEKGYWTEKIREHFHVRNVDNLTDFNYSKCFTYILNINDEPLFAGEKAMHDYIVTEGKLYRFEILISVLGPYVAYRYFKYYADNGSINLHSSSLPYENNQKVFGNSLIEFCKNESLRIVLEEDLRKTIDGVSLELAEEPVSIYNFFFEDSESKYPY